MNQLQNNITPLFIDDIVQILSIKTKDTIDELAKENMKQDTKMTEEEKNDNCNDIIWLDTIEFIGEITDIKIANSNSTDADQCTVLTIADNEHSIDINLWNFKSNHDQRIKKYVVLSMLYILCNQIFSMTFVCK